jgi:molybdenum cofactor cytidylyltransferase
MVARRTFALIPAAGLSRRMGCSKLSLLLGKKRVLERVIDAVRQATVHDVLVVLAPEGEELEALACSAGAHVLRLQEPTPDMRATVAHGLHWLEERFHPDDEDGWLLLPADHPTLQSEVIQTLLRARDDFPEKSIFIPTFQGRRGHPALIGWRHVPAILGMPAGWGLNLYVREQTAQVKEVPVELGEVLDDLDTPEDYHRLLRRWEEMDADN